MTTSLFGQKKYRDVEIPDAYNFAGSGIIVSALIFERWFGQASLSASCNHCICFIGEQVFFLGRSFL
jgi:hypothetical protein